MAKKAIPPWKPPAVLRTRARAILRRLEKAHPDWGPTLEFTSPFELLVATILAAQAQDEHINRVTRRLFVKYRRPADYVAVPVTELEADVHETGFFRMKAKAIRTASEQLLAEFGGEVPGTMEDLVRLRGHAGLADLRARTLALPVTLVLKEEAAFKAFLLDRLAAAR